jgi:quinol monooxygenase YgiN
VDGEVEVLIVGGSFEVEPGDRDAFIAERHDTMRSSRAEEGCLEYTFAADPIDPGRVVLFERWENNEALDRHLARLRDSPRAGGVGQKSASIVIYDVAGERQIGR